MLNESLLATAAPLSLVSLLINLAIGAVMSLILRWHFNHFSSALSNRQQFAQVFTFVILTTTLIITIVKSSLALSLGLVGALSIVRFRTPIKEPEDLAYLFLSISVGLGLGADQPVPTLLAAGFILVILSVLKLRNKKEQARNLYLSLDWEGENKTRLLDELNAVIKKHSLRSDIRRYDSHEKSGEAIYHVDITDSRKLSDLLEELKQAFPGIGVSFIDQNQMPVA